MSSSSGNLTNNNSTNNSTSKQTSNTTSPKPGAKVKPSSIQYSKHQKSGIAKEAKYIGSKTIYLPTQGFGSKFEYIQRLKASGGGYLLSVNYTRFNLNLNDKRPLTNWTIKNTVKLPMSGQAASPVTAQWLTPPSSHASLPNPVLSFKISGVYYTIWGGKSLNESQIEKIAGSFTKFKS